MLQRFAETGHRIAGIQRGVAGVLETDLEGRNDVRVVFDDKDGLHELSRGTAAGVECAAAAMCGEPRMS